MSINKKNPAFLEQDFFKLKLFYEAFSSFKKGTYFLIGINKTSINNLYKL